MEALTPEVTVHLKRYGEDQLLVIVRGDREDQDPLYFTDLFFLETAGFGLDPLDDPHRIAIIGGGIYGGKFIFLDDIKGGFAARPPRALIDLMLPNSATEANYTCEAHSGYSEIHFTLPEGGSLLSLFFKHLAPSIEGERCPPDACTAATTATV